MIPLFQVAMSKTVAGPLIDTLYSGYVGEGPQVQKFEKMLENHLGTPVLTTNSCTSALDLAYHLLGLEQGSRVLVTPQTCTATTLPLVHRGCEIVWLDVDRLTGNADPADVASKVTEDTKAIVVVDWAGVPCDYDALREAAQGVPIVEDAAHAFMAQYKGRPIGKNGVGGDLVAWSFQAIKALCTSDGGALKLPTEEMYERAKLLRWYGLDRTKSDRMRCLQQISDPGFKYHMNDVAATIGIHNLAMAVGNVMKHKENAAYYSQALSGVDGIEVPELYDGGSYWLYTILVPKRDEFEAWMAEWGVAVSMAHARNDIHPCLPRGENLPGLDYFTERMINIPVGWWVTEDDRVKIADLVKEWARKCTSAT